MFIKGNNLAEQADDVSFMHRIINSLLGICEDQRKMIERLSHLKSDNE